VIYAFDGIAGNLRKLGSIGTDHKCHDDSNLRLRGCQWHIMFNTSRSLYETTRSEKWSITFTLHRAYYIIHYAPS